MLSPRNELSIPLDCRILSLNFQLLEEIQKSDLLGNRFRFAIDSDVHKRDIPAKETEWDCERCCMFLSVVDIPTKPDKYSEEQAERNRMFLRFSFLHSR